jgi:hypothetical protein
MYAVFALVAALSAAGPPVGLPLFPVIIDLDQPSYSGKDHMTASLRNPSDQSVWVQPLMPIERSNGDGTWTPVYLLWATGECRRALPEAITECVEIPAKSSLKLEAWDWNTGGYTQCPPRRPGHRAFKGVHRITARWCDAKKPKGNAQPRVKLTTWE